MMNDTPQTKRAYNLGLKAVPNFLSLTLEQIAYYEQHLDQIPAAISRGFVVPAPIEKFVLLKTLDVVVPADYVHATQLAAFKKKHKKDCYFYNDEATDENFAKATTPLTPGRKFKVKVFRLTASGETTSVELLTFLRSQKAIFTGAQGASLVFTQQRQALPKSYWYASFDEKEALWKDADGFHRVPCVHARSGGVFGFFLGVFEDEWRDGHCLLCFCDE